MSGFDSISFAITVADVAGAEGGGAYNGSFSLVHRGPSVPDVGSTWILLSAGLGLLIHARHSRHCVI